MVTTAGPAPGPLAPCCGGRHALSAPRATYVVDAIPIATIETRAAARRVIRIMRRCYQRGATARVDPGSALLARDPRVDALLEHVEGQRAAAEHLVVEAA